MIIDHRFAEKHKVSVHDCSGSEIQGVVSFNTDSKEIEMLVWLVREPGATERPLLKTLSEDGSAVPYVAKIKLLGAYAIVDGQKI
jgi:hypothetical protein